MRLHCHLLLAVSLSMAACATEVEGEDDEPNLDESEIILHNKLRTEEIVLNSLTGTSTAIATLIANPLATATFDPDAGALPVELNDPNARAFMKYLVECALTPNDSISYTAYNDVTYYFRGLHGFCPAWASGAPDQACREIVTACILTRNNAEGKEVKLSVRGKTLSGASLALGSTVLAKSTSSTGSTIASFRSCLLTQNGAARNCGFTAAQSLVGTCYPGLKVTLTCAGGSSAIAARVCNTPSGCDHGSADNLAEGTACGVGTPPLSFTCGADGAFAAMVGPVTSGQAASGSFSSAVGGTFPASENQVFTIEEGSFYGDLFAAGGHNSSISRTVDAAGVVTTSYPPGSYDAFLDSWACHDAGWTDADAYMSDRLCASVNINGVAANMCAAASLGVCAGPIAPVCATGDTVPVGDGDNGGCRDIDDVVRPRALTVRLHDPCDLVPAGHDAACERNVIIR